MPLKVEGTWRKSEGRWTVMIDGKRFTRSWKQLGAEFPTIEATQHLWMNWVNGVRASLVKARPIPQRQQLISGIKQLALTTDDTRELAQLAIATERVKTVEQDNLELVRPDDVEIEEGLALANLVGINVPDGVHPAILGRFFGNQKVYDERKRVKKVADTSKTISKAIDEFLTYVRATSNKVRTAEEIAAYFEQLKNDKPFDLLAEVGDITAEIVNKHFAYLTNKLVKIKGTTKTKIGYDPGQHNKRLGFFRRFVQWCYDNHKLDVLPRNLKDKKHRRKVRDKKIQVWTSVWSKVMALPDSLRLVCLLGLNCGMTAVDCGSLTWDMIEEGWLTRTRVKTEGKSKDVPEVRYKLWEETLELLAKTPRRSNLVFTTSKGTGMYSDEKGVNLFDTYYKRLPNQPDVPLGKYRNIGATTLKKSELWRDYRDLFLGHASSKMSDKHYSAEDWKVFGKATDFIRDQLMKS